MSFTRIFEAPQFNHCTRCPLLRQSRGAFLKNAPHAIAALLGLYAIVFTFLALCQQTHTRRMKELERLLTIGVLDAESGQRAYLLTNDKTFLVQYRAGVKALAAYTPLYGQTLVDDRSKGLFQDVEMLLNLKTEEMALTIRLHDRASPAAAAGVVANRVGHDYTESIYRTLLDIRRIESERVAPFQLWRAPQQVDLHDPNALSRAGLFIRLTSKAVLTGLF